MTAAYFSMKTKQHGIAAGFGAFLTVVGYAGWLATSSSDVKARYAFIFINASGGFYGPLVLAWALSNASTDSARALTGATVSGLGGIGSIVASWSYGEDFSLPPSCMILTLRSLSQSPPTLRPATGPATRSTSPLAQSSSSGSSDSAPTRLGRTKSVRLVAGTTGLSARRKRRSSWATSIPNSGSIFEGHHLGLLGQYAA